MLKKDYLEAANLLNLKTTDSEDKELNLDPLKELVENKINEIKSVAESIGLRLTDSDGKDLNDLEIAKAWANYESKKTGASELDSSDELEALKNENQKLKDENQKLKDENQELKDEIEKLKNEKDNSPAPEAIDPILADRKFYKKNKELTAELEVIKKEWVPASIYQKEKDNFAKSKKTNSELRKEIVALKNGDE